MIQSTAQAAARPLSSRCAAPPTRRDSSGTFLLYLSGVLVCLTVSQKFIDIPQARPLLYAGLGLIVAHMAVLGLRQLIAPVPRIGIATALGGSVLLFVLLTGVSSARAVKDVLLTSTAHVGLLVTFRLYFRRTHDLRRLVSTVAAAIVLVTMGHALLAWWMLLGDGVLTIGTEAYAQQAVWGGRLHGIAGEPTHFGAMCGAAFLSALYILALRQRRLTPMPILLLLFLFASLVMSGTRNALLSTVIGAALYLYRLGRLRLAWRSWLLLFVAGFAGIQVISSGEPLQMLREAFRVGDTGSEDMRWDKYLDAWTTFKGSTPLELLVGRGFDYLTARASVMNQYVDLFFGFGAFGVSLFLVLNAVAAVRIGNLRNAWKHESAYGLGLLAFVWVFFLMLSPLLHVFHMAAFAFYFALYLAFSRYRPSGPMPAR